MQPLQQHCTPLAPLPGYAEIEKLIEHSLCGDWIIRVEHMGLDQLSHDNWHQWQNALFAVNNSVPVMEAIYACRASNPTHSIRMYAEKVQPQTRFIYSVYDASVNKPEKIQTMQQISPSPSSSPSANQHWGYALVARMRNSGNAMWRFVAVFGAVAGSIMLLEGTTG